MSNQYKSNFIGGEGDPDEGAGGKKIVKQIADKKKRLISKKRNSLSILKKKIL